MAPPLQLVDVGYFLDCVEGGSLVAGAHRAHVTPAAMTKALQRLESALGVALMARTTRGSKLTPEGERLVGPLRALLDHAEEVRAEVGGQAGVIAGELRILAMEVFSREVLPRAITSLVRAHPAVVPRAYENIPERMVELVATGRADVAFTIGRVESPLVSVHRLGTTPGLLVCARRHPLASRRSVTKSDVARYPSAVPRFWGAEHLPSLDQFPDDRWPRKVGATIELLEMAIALAVEGAFLGYFPAICVESEVSSRALVTLASPSAPPFELLALTPARGARPAAAALVDEVSRAIAASSRSAPRRRRARARA
jgi:DNA-binding transcriptional LysR family regulator